MVNHERAATAEAPNRSECILHVSTDKVDVVNLPGKQKASHSQARSRTMVFLTKFHAVTAHLGPYTFAGVSHCLTSCGTALFSGVVRCSVHRAKGILYFIYPLGDSQQSTFWRKAPCTSPRWPAKQLSPAWAPGAQPRALGHSGSTSLRARKRVNVIPTFGAFIVDLLNPFLVMFLTACMYVSKLYIKYDYTYCNLHKHTHGTTVLCTSINICRRLILKASSEELGESSLLLFGCGIIWQPRKISFPTAGITGTCHYALYQGNSSES